MNSLLEFNAFGLVKATQNSVTVTLTAITKNGKAITRVLSADFDQPVEGFGETDFSSATIAALIEEGSKSQLVYNDLVAVPGVPQVGDLPGVSKAIARTINLIRTELSKSASK